jgi:hypothetical protein
MGSTAFEFGTSDFTRRLVTDVLRGVGAKMREWRGVKLPEPEGGWGGAPGTSARFPGEVFEGGGGGDPAPLNGGGGGDIMQQAMKQGMGMIPGGMQGLLSGLPLPLPVTIAGFGAGGFSGMMGMMGGGSGGIMGTGISMNPLDWIGKPFGLGSAGGGEGPGPAERAGAKMGLRSSVAGPDGFTSKATGGGAGGAPDMDKWTKSMSSLGTQMGAFTEAFQGGMIWKIEGTHDINVNLNGAEVFGTLTEMFETYVLGKTGSAIKNWFKEHMPEKGIVGSVQHALGFGGD